MKHITLVSFVVATLILSIAGCSQLSEEEIAELVAAEVSKQTSGISDIVATTTLDITELKNEVIELCKKVSDHTYLYGHRRPTPPRDPALSGQPCVANLSDH